MLERILELIEELTSSEDAREVVKKAQSKKIRLQMEEDPSVRDRLRASGKKGLQARWGKK
jgi:hypothetical protein